ncbi:MAG TPA: hypothetical protein VER03_24460 [Bryobacteraceae bacterium]|nr:hypothetical protein [Bryobacteraceae bacterium]
MLRFILVITLAMGCALAEVSVPKGATEIEPGVFKHTDSAGKTSIYRKTPFGVVKSADAPASAPAAKAAPPAVEGASPFGDVKQNPKTQDVKVVERGDTLEFERPSPFGSYKWKAKKSELNAEEKEAWAKARGQHSPAKTAGPKE